MGSLYIGNFVSSLAFATIMGPLLVVSLLLFGTSAAGPVKRSVDACAQDCPADSKFQYSKDKTYVYSYEASNAMRMGESSELSSVLKATIEISRISNCEMMLQVMDANVRHGSSVESSSKDIEDLKKHALRFSWSDGIISHVCPHPEDTENVNNMKRGILSALQNSMKTLDHDTIVRETDVLGSCDTEYKVKSHTPTKISIHKKKVLPTCSNHVKGRTGLTSALYESPSSAFQHLPVMSDQDYSCHNSINNGLIEEVFCVEKVHYKPLSTYSYAVKARGETKLQLLSSKASKVNLEEKVGEKESLVYVYEPKVRENLDDEAEASLQAICNTADGLLNEDVGAIVHKLVHVLRGLSVSSVQKLYDSLKSGSLCRSPKVLGIFIDSLKSAASAGAVEVLTKLATSGDLSFAETSLWLASLPFSSYAENHAVQAASPLLRKSFNNNQALLSVPAFAHKYCQHHPNCESDSGVQSIIAELEKHLVNDCHATTKEEEQEIIGALKGYGNLGYFTKSPHKDAVLKCVTTTTNSIPLRTAALESFRRSPCTETISSELLKIYENVADEDEIRIHALIALSKCPSPQIVFRLGKSYLEESSRQVKVYTWSYLKNLRSTSDPLKQKARHAASHLTMKTPSSVDLTKFSRNFESSNFEPHLNLGYGFGANLIYSHDSFLPRTGNADLTVDVFGHQLNLLEVGVRVENAEHNLEALFGPRGYLEGLTKGSHHVTPNANGSTPEMFNSKIQSLKEKVGFKSKHPPEGSYYIRILGNELRWRHIDIETLQNLADFDVEDIINDIAKIKNIDNAHSLLFLDHTIVLPSVTGRAYKLAANGSTTLGMQADRKIDIRKLELKNLLLNLDGKYKPSATVQIDGTMSIYGENYEPTFKVATSLNAGHNFAVKVDMDEGPSVNFKLDYPSKTNRLLALKRDFYEYGPNGEKLLAKPKMHEFHYCTKYINALLGLEFCGNLNFPHWTDEAGNHEIAFLGPMEASLEMKKTDEAMKGYEFKLKLPDWESDTHRYKVLFDTPGSQVERKFLAELVVIETSPDSKRSAIKLHSPFYHVEIDGTCLNKPDKLEVKVDAVGDGKRRYGLVLNVDKAVKGARLAEYKPTLTVNLPRIEPIIFSGTVVFSKGRKDLISFTINSDKIFNQPFSLKGSIDREGNFGRLDSRYHISSDVTILALSRTNKLYGTYERSGFDVNLDVSLDCSTDSKNPKSLKFKAALKDVNFSNSLSFVAESEMLTSEYPDHNFQTKWEFSSKLNHHLQNDVLIRYGANFDDEDHKIHFLQLNKFDGDFHTFQHMDIDNKLSLNIPKLKINKSLFATIFWGFQEKPKVHINIGVQVEKNKYYKTEVNFESFKNLHERPIKLTSSFQVVVLDYEFVYRTEVQEASLNVIQGREVLQIRPGHQITVDFVYNIRSTDQVFYHEYECTITAPNLVAPVKHKMYLKRSRDVIEFGSNTNTGNRSPFVLDVKLNSNGPGEISVDLPVLVGKLSINNQATETLLEADFKTTGRQPQQIIGKGRIYHEGDNQLITANLNYAKSVDVAINGKLNDNLLLGTHELRADFSGSIEPMAIVANYAINEGQLHANVKYLRNNDEKLSVDFNGKYIRQVSHFEFESGVLLTSPYKAFDGKEVYLHFLWDSNDAHHIYDAEYRVKPNVLTATIAKLTYNRKKGWPGHIKSNALITVNKRVLFERSTAIVYGGGKYSFKTSLIPSPGRRMNVESSVEFSGRYAAIHQSITTSLQHLQHVRLNAIADFREGGDYKVQSNVDVNSYKVYDLNTTMTIKSITDFDMKMVLLGNLVPSVHIYSKAQNANSLTKYSLSLEKDSTEIMSGKGEIKKRKKGFSGDMVFNYKGKDFMTININNEVKSQKERHYVFKFKSFYRTYSINVNSLKEKKTTKTAVDLCRNENDNCVNIVTTHKEGDGIDEWQITYKRADLELNFDRIYESTADAERRYFVVHSGGTRYGYDIKYGEKDSVKNVFLGLILPSRHMTADVKFSGRGAESFLSFETSADAEKHPERKFSCDIKVDNQIGSNLPSKLDITVKHPVLKKPVELLIVADYNANKAKYFELETAFDYSLDPEDKILTKTYVEKTSDHATTATTFVYHQIIDDEHLDFTIKRNFSSNDGRTQFGEEWLWKNDDHEEETAFVFVTFDRNQEIFNLVYHRPRLDFRIDAAATMTENLLENLSKVDINVHYNGATTKALFTHDYSGHCYELHIFGDSGEVIRKVDLCADVTNPVLFSLKTTSIEEDQLVFDYSLEVVRPSLMSINVRHHWNPEFLGGIVYQSTRLSEELMDAGVGTLPISKTARHKKIMTSLQNNLVQPLTEFVGKEWTEVCENVRSDIRNLREKLHDYYKNLPSNPIFVMGRRLLKVLKPTIDELVEEFWDRIHELNENLHRQIDAFRAYLKDLEQRFSDRCANIPECRFMRKAVVEKEWKNVLEVIKSLILRLPESVQRYVERGGKIEVALQKAHKILMIYAKPLMEYESVKNTLHALENFREAAREKIEQMVHHYYGIVRKHIDQFIEENGKYTEVAFAEIKKIFEDIHNQDFASSRQTFKKLLEEILSAIPLPSLRSLFKINVLDPERGVFSFDLYFPLSLSFLKDFVDSVHSSFVGFEDVPLEFNWKQVLVKVKRITDLQIVPPYREQAVLLGYEHYITFDKTFYDFDGECAYLLASDLEDGNFSLVITPTFSLETDKASGDRTHSFGVIVKDTAVLINLQDKTVRAGEHEVDLPYLTKDLSVIQEEHVISIDDHYGVKVKCHTVYHFCVATISGWYYGKTAGLFGTYDYEPANDFRRPKGQIPNSVTTFAKSWDISRNCKTKNFAPEVKIQKDDNIYRICEEYFESQKSPLSPCFSEVNPQNYFALCYRHLYKHKSADINKLNKALCEISATYVVECERNYIELNLPPKCITCQAPDGSVMKHGEKKKYENFERKSSETIFVIESRTCNDRLLKDIDSVTKAIDKELTNDGNHNNLFGIVAYGSGNEPMIYTAHSKLIYPVNDVAATAKKIQLTNESSTSALEAVRLALSYPFSSSTSKSVILMACSPCHYDYKSLQYPVIQQILLEQEIVLHVINNYEIKLRKISSKERNIIGVDADTVYFTRDVTQRELVGEPSLRSQVVLAKDACIALAQDVSGSFFSSHSLPQETKAWRSIFARRLLKTARISKCRWCDCTSTANHVSKVVCRPCENRRPKLPFSVCSSCHLPGKFTGAYSLLLRHIL